MLNADSNFAHFTAYGSSTVTNFTYRDDLDSKREITNLIHNLSLKKNGLTLLLKAGGKIAKVNRQVRNYELGIY
jgi:hypothetical protein